MALLRLLLLLLLRLLRLLRLLLLLLLLLRMCGCSVSNLFCTRGREGAIADAYQQQTPQHAHQQQAQHRIKHQELHRIWSSRAGLRR